MAQQINLLTPILLAPRKHFSALAMVQGLGLVLLGISLLGLWMQGRAQQARQAHAAVVKQAEEERTGLLQALNRLPQSADPKQLEQQLSQLEAQNAQLAQQIQALRSGLRPPGQRYSDLLDLISSSIPEPVWLSQLNWQPGQLQLIGGTLDPLPLRHWVASLSSQAQLGGAQISEVQLEKVGSLALQQMGKGGGPVSAKANSAQLFQLPPNAPPSWQFDIQMRAATTPRLAAPQAASGARS